MLKFYSFSYQFWNHLIICFSFLLAVIFASLILYGQVSNIIYAGYLFYIRLMFYLIIISSISIKLNFDFRGNKK